VKISFFEPKFKLAKVLKTRNRLILCNYLKRFLY